MVTKERAESNSIKFTKPASEVKAPFAGRDEEEEFKKPLPQREEETLREVTRAGKMPLHPAVIRLPFSIFGRIGTELTGYPGFTFTEQELNDLADLWVMCGIEMNPILQASIGTTSMVGAKCLGYFAWTKAGKPPIPGAKAIGEEQVKKEEQE